jgi:glycosyltransferase involved in cell wall biosynthesis
VNGFLIPPRDPVALAAYLQLLIDRPEMRWQMVQEARLHAERHFDVIKNAARIAELMVQTVEQVGWTKTEYRHVQS